MDQSLAVELRVVMMKAISVSNYVPMLKSIVKIVALFISATSVFSCVIEPVSEYLPEVKTITTITAGPEPAQDTKTLFDPIELTTSWLEGDAINVFFGNSVSSKFVCQNSGEIAQFKGSIDVVTGGGEGLTEDTSLWGVYPYSPQTVCDGTSITYTLPSDQPAATGTIPSGLFPTIARSSNFLMSFYILCGSFRFTVSNPDIVKVTIRGNNDEEIAGRARITMDGYPEVSEIYNGAKELTITAPDGGCFEVGEDYFFVLYPTAFTKGLTLTYYKEGYKATYVYNSAYELKRKKFARFRDKDKDLVFEPITLTDWEEGENIGGEI